MKIEGYHNTGASNVEDILKHGVTYTQSDQHWLGQGIYFFADIDTAIDNLEMLKHNDEVKTIAVEIDVDDCNFLNLDITRNLNAFRKYCQTKFKALKESGEEWIIKESDRKKAMLKYRCFFMDLYKYANKYDVITKTFPEDSPKYAEKIEGIGWLGLPFLEKYICVSDNGYIVKKNLVTVQQVCAFTAHTVRK